MRAVLLAIVASAACHAAKPAPFVPARHAIPAFAGAVWSGPCTVTFGPASATERAARIAAMQTWLPPGSRIELSELGDRARRVWIPGARVADDRAAAHRARLLVKHAAALFGGTLPRDADTPRVTETPRAWVAELAIQLTEPHREGSESVDIVAVIDRRSGEGRLGLLEEMLPFAPLCERDRPAIDEMAFVDAALGREMPRRSHLEGDDAPSTITRFDVVVAKQLRAETTGHTTRAVVDVFVGPDAATAPDDASTIERVRGRLVVDAATHEVLDFRPWSAPGWCGTRPARDVLADARQLFPD